MLLLDARRHPLVSEQGEAGVEYAGGERYLHAQPPSGSSPPRADAGAAPSLAPEVEAATSCGARLKRMEQRRNFAPGNPICWTSFDRSPSKYFELRMVLSMESQAALVFVELALRLIG